MLSIVLSFTTKDLMILCKVKKQNGRRLQSPILNHISFFLSGLDVSFTGSGGSQSEESDAQLGIRSSKRKRKAPTPIDEDVGPMCMPSWARAALK